MTVGKFSNPSNTNLNVHPVGRLVPSLHTSPPRLGSWGADLGFLQIEHDAALDCLDSLTLTAWIYPYYPYGFPANGGRIIDKSPVGEASGYLLDTYPGNSLRLITRDPHLIYRANLPTNQWSHVAATVDGQTGKQILYLNGKPMAESP